MKRSKTNSKEVRQAIRKHIIDRISTEDFEEHDETLKTSLQIIAYEFQRVACYPNILKRLGAYQNVFVDWLKGLPSCFDFEFMTYKINEFMESIGLAQAEKETDTETAELYHYLIYVELKKLMHENNIEFPKF